MDVCLQSKPSETDELSSRFEAPPYSLISQSVKNCATVLPKMERLSKPFIEKFKAPIAIMPPAFHTSEQLMGTPEPISFHNPWRLHQRHNGWFDLAICLRHFSQENFMRSLTMRC